MITGVCALIAVPLAALAGSARAEPLTVFAAASLREALDEAAAGFSGEVVLSYGGSGAMARQVALGAPADVVILANEAWLRWLDDEGALRAGSVARVMGNRLVLVGPEGAAPLEDLSAEALRARLAGGRMALGQVLSVPAGIYAKEWMQSSGLWEALAPHLAETENVRAALALVERGEVALGVVYATDARAARVAVVREIGAETHSPIAYWAAVTEASEHPQAEAFIAHLMGPAQDGFAALGFVPRAALGALP